MKRFFIFAGPNGSGKSSVISSLKNSVYASPLSGRDIDFDVMTYVNADFCARQDPEISQMPAGKERDVAAWNATNRWRDDTLQSQGCEVVYLSSADMQEVFEQLPRISGCE